MEIRNEIKHENEIKIEVGDIFLIEQIFEKEEEPEFYMLINILEKFVLVGLDSHQIYDQPRDTIQEVLRDIETSYTLYSQKQFYLALKQKEGNINANS